MQLLTTRQTMPSLWATAAPDQANSSSFFLSQLDEILGSLI